MALLCDNRKMLGMDKTELQALFDQHPDKVQVALSRAIGKDQSVVNKILKGTRQIKAVEVPIIQEFFGLKPSPVVEPPREILAPNEMPRDVGVEGIASCGPDGAFIFENGTIDFVRRPPRLRGVQGAYALYCQGSSMSPWREEGQTVYVHPGVPALIGDYVVVQTRDFEHASAAYIKRLAKRTASEVRLQQYNPAKEISVPTKKVVTIHRILDWSELLGI